MARRRARVATRPVAIHDVLPPSARVAWTYLAVVLAAVGAAGLVVLANQTVSVVACAVATGGDDPVASCKVGVAIWVALVGFLLCLAPALLLVKLDWWLWAAMAAAAGLLVAADAVTEWWWWLLAALVPAAAALATAEWGGGAMFRRGQRIGVLVLDAAAVLTLVWWYLRG